MKLSSVVSLAVICAAATVSRAALLIDNTGATDIVTQWGSGNAFADDGATGSRGIGFNFPFYGVNKISIFHGANGITTFGSGSTAFANTALASSPTTTIAVLWDDLRPQFDNTQSAPKTQAFEQKTIANIYAFSGVNNRIRISGGGDSSLTVSYQVALFGANTTYAGFNFLLGDIALSYNSLVTPTTGDFTVGVHGTTSALFTPLPGDSDGLVNYNPGVSLLPTGSNFILFRYNSTTGQYVSSIQSASVPEPTSAGLVAGAVALMAGRRRRA